MDIFKNVQNENLHRLFFQKTDLKNNLTVSQNVNIILGYNLVIV